MKSFVFVFILGLVTVSAKGQSLIGSWQLSKQTTCIESELPAGDPATDDLVEDMKNMGGASPQVIQFKEKNEGEESTRILTKKKAANKTTFLYKYDGSTLYILDKKSRVIIDTYTVESLNEDSLIISNAARACETKVFVRVK